MQSNCSNSTLQAVESSCLSLKTSASLLLPHLLSAHSSLSTTPHMHAGISPLLCAHQLMETCRYLALCVETLCLSAQVGLYTYVTGRKSNKLYIYRRHMNSSAYVRACNCTICSNAEVSYKFFLSRNGIPLHVCTMYMYIHMYMYTQSFHSHNYIHYIHTLYIHTYMYIHIC